MNGFSFARLFAMLLKESLQMRRDRATVALTVMLPLIQLFLFGYAINANPRHLPTGLIAAEHTTRLLTPDRSWRKTAGADGRGRHRPDGDRQCDGSRGGTERHRAEP
jgi:hypothetical protein